MAKWPDFCRRFLRTMSGKLSWDKACPHYCIYLPIHHSKTFSHSTERREIMGPQESLSHSQAECDVESASTVKQRERLGHKTYEVGYPLFLVREQSNAFKNGYRA
jgi:hypothetical protein